MIIIHFLNIFIIKFIFYYLNIIKIESTIYKKNKNKIWLIVENVKQPLLPLEKKPII